jgi:hypothetical protein
MATLIGAMAGKSRKLAPAQRKLEPPVSLTAEQRRAFKRIDDFRREIAARNRQLEQAHRSLTARLELARAILKRAGGVQAVNV